MEIRSWSAEDGLPADHVTSIQQTSDGFLWVGTMSGLARFDGRSFAPVAIPGIAAAGSTQRVEIASQVVDNQQQLWFGTDRKGLFRLDTRKPNLSATLAGLADERVYCLGVEATGVLWIGTEQGLVRFDNGKFEQIPYESKLNDPSVLAVQVTRSNGVWATTQSGLHRVQNGKMQKGEFDPNLKTPFLGVFEDRAGALWGFGDTYLLNLSENRRFNYFRGGGATQLQVWSICEGRAGQLWIGTSGQGLFYFAGVRFHAVDLQQVSGHSGVRAVFSDRDGQIWVGTRGGLLRLKEKVVRWFPGSGSAATALVEDRDGKTWAGFEHGGLLSGKDGQLEVPAASTPLAGLNLISSMYARGDGSLWVGTLGNGLYRVKDGRAMHYSLAHGLSDESVLAICAGHGGRVWVATSDGRVHRFLEHLAFTFDEQHGLTGSPATAMTRASEVGVWLGTRNGEVLRFARERFTQLPAIPQFAGRKISALLEIGTNSLWVASQEAGLAHLANGRWQVWNVNNGLPNNQVIGLERSRSGDLWVATVAGIIRLPAQFSTNSVHYGGRHHLIVEFPGTRSEEEWGWPRSLRSRDGLLWFATSAGVVCFNPENLRLMDSAPRVYVEALRVNGGQSLHQDFREPGEREFTLPPGLRDMEVQFTAPTLLTPERTRFRHKLEGFDPDWLDSSATRTARYGRLPSGRYEFRVAASDAEGGWTGPETRVRIAVRQPLWQQPWAITMQVLLLATVVGGVVRVISHRRLRRQLARAEQQRVMERERSRIAQDMHDELGAKLTKISFLSERARNDVAADSPTSAKLDSIAVTSRELLHSLDEIVWAVNPKNDTLEHLAAYLGQYAAEYLQSTSVEHELSIPGNLPDIPLRSEVRHNLFLAFEETLGNALKHSGATKLQINMRVEDEEFIIQVRDNGRGLAAGAKGGSPGSEPGRRGMGGSGLRGMRDRLSQTGGGCEIESEPGRGTCIALRIPLNYTSKGIS